MSRRSQALYALIGLLVALVLGVFAIPVPYLTLSPGPVCDTVGLPDKTDCQSTFATGLIQITPASLVHNRTNDVLALTTVEEDDTPTLSDALQSYFSTSQAVLPREVLFPPGESTQQATQQENSEMAMSQDTATVAALTHIGLVRVTVTQVVPGGPSSGVLRVGDVLTSLDGAPLGNKEVLITELETIHPGRVVTVGYIRAGMHGSASVTTGNNPQAKGVAFLGVGLSDDFADGITVKVGLKGIGGPSAGLMLALGILDELSPTSLTGGRVVAGTGTIDDLGNVGAIGGIQQKMYAARHDEHATIFLAPAGDCSEAKGAIPEGLQVVSVNTLTDALRDLAALRAGNTHLPSC